MRTIRGAVLERSAAPRPYATSRPLVVTELQLEDPGPGELLLRVEAAGLCHSDLSVVDGNRPRPLPMLLGHESAGTVEAVGAGVDDVAPGDRVVTTFLPRCERCAACATGGRVPCTTGSATNAEGVLPSGARRLSRDGAPVHHHLGVSAFATHAVVDRRSVVPVPADVPADLAALLGCAVLTGGGAVRNAARPEPGQTLAVVGLGGVGMAALLVAAGLDGVRTLAVDTSPDKLRTARELGADEVATPEELAASGRRVEKVVEAAGSARAFETAFAVTAVGGTTVTVGLPAPGSHVALDPLVLTAEARTVVGSYLGSAVPARDLPEYVAMWRQGRLPLERLVSGHLGLEEIGSGFDRLADATVLRLVLTP